MMSSSGTKRMSWFSGLPQLASAALVPVIAVTLMKERRSIASEVTGQAVDRGAVLVMTVHAEPHVQVDIALRHGLLGEIAVAGGALHLAADVRRVVELDVGLSDVTVYAAPLQ